MNSMHDVFISYSTKEQTMAETVRNVLEKNGIPCWMAPRDIPGGSNYSKEIPVAIRGCQAFVLILSGNAQRSQWVLRELDMAVNCGKVILPFMLEDCPLCDEFNFLLTGAQRYAAYQKKAEAMENLINRIRAVVSAGKEAPAVEEVSTVAEMPESFPREEEARKEPEKKTVDAFLGMSRCPACGGENLTQLTKVGRYMGKNEWLYYLWALPVCVLMFFAGALVLGLSGSISLWLLVWIAGSVLGIILVRKVTDKNVQRLRVRRQIRPYPCRCDKCDWVFLQNEDGSAVSRK